MIRKANSTEHNILTKIAFLSKQTWNYPKDYMDLWKEELTITSKYIEKNIVLVYEDQNKIVGFISLVYNLIEKKINDIFIEKGFWMDHLFIHPEFQNRNIGKKLVKQLLEDCTNNQIESVLIFVDPNAVGFYEKIGAEFLRTSASSIPGRELPVYQIKLYTKTNSTQR